MMTNDERPIVVKVGGSLFDLPDLGKRLRAWFSQFDLQKVVIVPGGGQAADAVRLFDRVQSLGDETAHWCALQAMTLNAHLLGAALSSDYAILNSPADLHYYRGLQLGRDYHLLSAADFIRGDDTQPDHLPHTWGVSSDSIAARAAVVLKAGKLILLKSVTIPSTMAWYEASQRGYVDKYFPTALAKAGDLEVEAVNFRQWQPPT
jgi:aspartokinase-like uncharacterized kinase